MKATINHLLLVVLIYPILLFFPSLVGKEAFFITAPYFFLIFLLICAAFLSKSNLTLRTDKIAVYLALLVACSFINFSSARYSLPIFFTIYTLFFYVFIENLEDKSLSFKLIGYYFILMIALSVPMLFLKSGYTEANRFTGFIGSPTIYSGFVASFFIITSFRHKMWTLKFMIFFFITLYLVYISKTRLLLILILVYPILRLTLQKRAWVSRKLIFLLFYLSSLMIYPLYSSIINLFPSLVTLRYGKKEDSSFSLRNYLFEELKDVFLKSNSIEVFLGRGNEFSRLYIERLMGFDLMPHNDFLRLLIDWGILGFLIYSIILYKIATKNDLSLYLSLVYMLLFYSNTIFNLFLISLLLIFYHNTNNQASPINFGKVIKY